jgi:hypothetical protein
LHVQVLGDVYSDNANPCLPRRQLLALSAPRRSRPDIRRCFGAAAGGDYERSGPNSVSLRLGNFKLAAGPGIEWAALVVLVELTFSGEHRITVCPVRVEDGLFKLFLRCHRGSLDISGASIRDNEHALVEGVSCCGHQAVPLSSSRQDRATSQEARLGSSGEPVTVKHPGADPGDARARSR